MLGRQSGWGRCVGLGTWQTHLSHSPLSGTFATRVTEGQIGKLFQTVSVFCSAGVQSDVITYLA